MLKTAIIFFIKIYQYTISPLFGNCCRFTPSCSEYAQVAIKKHGTLLGVWLMLRRLLKCHPWCGGGEDLVP